jgi:hypothetical protein
MVISPITTYQSVSQFSYPYTDIVQTSHRHHIDMCSMYDVGRITSKPYLVGGLPNLENGLENLESGLENSAGGAHH